MQNDFKIAPKLRVFSWIAESLFLMVDRPIFWLMYASIFSFLFSLSSHVIYLHFIAILCVLCTLNVSRYFYSGFKIEETWLNLKKHILMLILLLFFSVVVRYLFWLCSGQLSLETNIFEDYINPLVMIKAGLWNTHFDLFLFNLVVMPYHYTQIAIFTLFFTATVFFYPLFIWKNNSALFSYRLNLRIILANFGNVALMLLFMVILSLLVFLFPLLAFPYLYVWGSITFYTMWADIFYEHKEQVDHSAFLIRISAPEVIK